VQDKLIATLTMNPAIDKSAVVERVVADRKLRCGPPTYEPGGGGINVSRAIRKLGGGSLVLYAAGGLTGLMLTNLLDREELSHQSVPIEGSTRENLTVLEESTGRQYRYVMPGPTLKEAEWQRCLEEASNLAPKPDYFVCSGSLPPGCSEDFYARLAKLARDQGSRIIVDTSAEALRLAVQAGVYLIKANLREFGELAGLPRMDESQTEALARELVESGKCEAVVVSLGAAGALLVSEAGCERLRAPQVPIISKVGAGDSMVAGLVLGLARDQSLHEAVRFGVASGAAAVMTPGTELCRREDTERLYRQILADQGEKGRTGS
jgi:6-phosphofructokinase 2